MNVIKYMGRRPIYFELLGFRPHIEKVMLTWRSEKVAPEVAKELEASARRVPKRPVHQVSDRRGE